MAQQAREERAASVTWGGKIAIVGAYESPRRNAPGVHPFTILAECVKGALEDAGLDLADVDGLCVASGGFGEGGGTMEAIEVAEYLGIRPTYADATDLGGCSYVSHAGHAAAAIHCGMAEVVVIAYASCPRWWPIGPIDMDVHPAGPGQYELPYGPTTVSRYALIAQRHMHEYGTTSEQLAEIAVVCRANAADNPDARYREPITVADVLESPVIASPLHRLDCCVVTDSGGAIVVTSNERARDHPKPIWLLGFGESVRCIEMNQMIPLTETPGLVSGARAFATAGMTSDEIDVAQLYDAFTITVLLALEDLGFCAKGEGGSFVEAGNIAPDGPVPINTDGGGLSSNHPGKRGIFLLIEAVRQLRGQSPGVQVKSPQTALVHALGGQLSATSTMILGT